MSDWRRVRLDECCAIVGGATPSTSVPAYWDGDICWATPKDLSDLEGAHIADTPRKLTKEGLASCAADVLPAGSVLFSSRAPIGHVALNTVPMATNQGFKSFIPKPELLDAKFLYHWLRWNRKYLESLGNGATFKEVSKAVVSRIEILLPPLPEQRRNAEVLDRAEALRAKRRAAHAQLDTLTQSIFLDMFGDPATNPKGWPEHLLGALAHKITDGEHLNPVFSSSGMPLVMAGNVLDDGVDFGSAKTVEKDIGLRFRKKCGPTAGDVLLVSRGATIGRQCVVMSDLEFCLMGSVILIKPHRDKLDPRFLNIFLRFPSTRSALYKTSGSSAQQAIYLKDLKSLSCISPPITLQREFARCVGAVEALRAAQRVSLQELGALFAALQHRLFSGEMTLTG